MQNIKRNTHYNYSNKMRRRQRQLTINNGQGDGHVDHDKEGGRDRIEPTNECVAAEI